MGIFRIKESQSKLGRDFMDDLRNLEDRLLNMESHFRTMEQAKDDKPGTLSVRSDNVSGQVTLGSGHGIVSGTLFNLHWAGGVRSGVVAGNVSGDNVPFSGGTGDNLPAADSGVSAVHFTTLAAEIKAVDSGGTNSPNAAYDCFNEVASMIGVSAAAVKQCKAKAVTYNG